MAEDPVVKTSHQRILKDVSRSFYLSIRFLPGPMREPIALGYLLARLTDTIADAPGLEPEARRNELDRVRLFLQGRGEMITGFGDSWMAGLSHPGEKALVARAPELFDWWAGIEASQRDHLGEVLLTILHGQIWDTTAFLEKGKTPCSTGDDLLRYTYWVAGCVGEFWTKVGFTTLGRGFAEPEDASRMLVTGRKLGQALQLINILRDLHEDFPAGRCYLPEKELREAGWDGHSMPVPEEVEPVFQRWLGCCESFLEETDSYVGRIRSFRVRFCTRLPMLLARATADQLRAAGVEAVMEKRIRISRATVWKEMIRAILF